MTLDEFIAEQKAHLQKFEENWRFNNMKDCVSYPYSMNPGDWDEQLTISMLESDEYE